MSYQCLFSDPRKVEFVRGRSTNLALSTRGIEPLKAAGALESVSYKYTINKFCTIYYIKILYYNNI